MEWLNRALLQHLGCRWASRRLEPLYPAIHVGIPIFNSWEHSSYASHGDIWPWVEIAIRLGIWNTTWEADAYRQIYHGDEKLLMKNFVRNRLHLALDLMKTCYDVRAYSSWFYIGGNNTAQIAARQGWTLCDHKASEWHSECLVQSSPWNGDHSFDHELDKDAQS